MTPEDYKTAIAALSALYDGAPSDSLGVLLGAMQLNKADNLPMDPGALDDWQRISESARGISTLERILAFLKFDASRYDSTPDDLQRLIAALEDDGSPERAIAQSVIDRARMLASPSSAKPITE